MGKIALLLPIGILLLASCKTTGSFCDIAKPIRPTAEQIEEMTDAQVADLLAHNEKGRALCRWRP